MPKRTIELLGAATPARTASKPNWIINMALAVIVGCLLGMGVAVSIEYFDTSFRNVADIETRLGVPVVGVIPWLNHADEFDPDDMVASEPFRVLQTNLNLALGDQKSAAISVVSAGPGEGKSTTVHRLALIMARGGQKVLLIDADLRRPTQHRLGDWPRSPGLSDYLQGMRSLDEVLQREAAPGLDFIPSGGQAGFTLGMLHTRRLKELLDTMRERYDRILFDSPPIIGVSDASVLATAMDGALLLIQHRRNPQAMTLRAQQTLRSARTELFGAILNQVPNDSGEDYGYYAHNYAYYSDTGRSSSRSRRKSSRRDASGPRGDADEGPERLDLQEPNG